jgi:hypothetical protein
LARSSVYIVVRAGEEKDKRSTPLRVRGSHLTAVTRWVIMTARRYIVSAERRYISSEWRIFEIKRVCVQLIESRLPSFRIFRCRCDEPWDEVEQSEKAYLKVRGPPRVSSDADPRVSRASVSAEEAEREMERKARELSEAD